MISNNRRRANRSRTSPEISLTPLIDTALVLLVIFMITTPILHNAIKIDLPKGNKQEAQSDSKDIIVYIDAHENIYIDEEKKPKKLDDLINYLEQKIGSKKDQKVFIDADVKISYGTVFKIVDRIKYVGGVENVILSSQRA